MTIATTLEMIGSGTRSAAIAAVVSVIAALLLTRRFTLLVSLAVLVGSIVLLFLKQVLLLFNHDPSSVLNRFFLWREAITLIFTHPWVGIGLQQFPRYYSQLIVSPATMLNRYGISIHNQYLELALESGILWLVVAVLLLTTIAFTSWRAYRLAPRSQQSLFLAALLALLATIVTSFVDVPLDKPESAVFLFLLAGMALGYAERFRCRTAFTSITAPLWLSSVSLMLKGEET